MTIIIIIKTKEEGIIMIIIIHIKAEITITIIITTIMTIVMKTMPTKTIVTQNIERKGSISNYFILKLVGKEYNNFDLLLIYKLK